MIGSARDSERWRSWWERKRARIQEIEEVGKQDEFTTDDGRSMTHGPAARFTSNERPRNISGGGERAFPSNSRSLDIISNYLYQLGSRAAANELDCSLVSQSIIAAIGRPESRRHGPEVRR